MNENGIQFKDRIRKIFDKGRKRRVYLPFA